MSKSFLPDSFEAMERAQSSEELRREMHKFAQEVGFDRFAYALTITMPSLRRQQYVLSGYPKDWGKRYLAQDYFRIDPVVLHAQTNSLPVIWSERQFDSGRTAEFWEEAHAYGLCFGLTFAVHEQPGVSGIFSLASDQRIEQQGKDLAALIGRAQLFASLLHQAVARIDLPRLLPEANVVLTARERECLRWSAEGKTAWELGQILGITERTAVFHTNNAVQKLGAANKTQAIVRALALRLI